MEEFSKSNNQNTAYTFSNQNYTNLHKEKNCNIGIAASLIQWFILIGLNGVFTVLMLLAADNMQEIPFILIGTIGLVSILELLFDILIGIAQVVGLSRKMNIFVLISTIINLIWFCTGVFMLIIVVVTLL